MVRYAPASPADPLAGQFADRREPRFFGSRKRIAPRAFALSAFVTLAFVPLTTGCNQAKVQELVDKAKESVATGADKATKTLESTAQKASTVVQERLSLAGSADLTLEGPLRTQACYVELVRVPGGGRHLVQLRSYKDASVESFPSFFAQASTDAAEASELAGKSVEARLFVRTAADAPVWQSAADSPVTIRFGAWTDQTLSAEIVVGVLRQVGGETERPIAGKLEAVAP